MGSTPPQPPPCAPAHPPQPHTQTQDPFLDGHNLVDKALSYRTQLGFTEANLGEFAAFIAYAQSYVRPS